jgi:phosphoribosylaminoimidazole (AIR) synthetase
MFISSFASTGFHVSGFSLNSKVKKQNKQGQAQAYQFGANTVLSHVQIIASHLF